MKSLFRVRSCYSLLHGVSFPEDIVGFAADRGYGAVSISDLGNFYGVRRFLSAAKKRGIKPIVGTEISTAEGSANLIAMDRTGFSNISTILSRVNLGNGNLLELIKEFSSSVVVLTKDENLAASLLGEVENLYGIAETAGSVPDGLAPVVAPPIDVLNPKDAPVHRLLRAIGTNSTVTSVKSLVPGELTENSRLFEIYPEAERNMAEIAEKCTLENLDYGFTFPKYPVENPDELLRKRAEAGLSRRYGIILPEHRQRLRYELEIIWKMGYSSYFLFVADIVSGNPRICGRGSGASSIVAYLLFITNVDPVRHNLYFERFLNPERKDPPDIDIDFAWDEREEIVKRVMERYGSDHTAMVSTMNTFRFRGAFREVSRACGMPDGETGVMERKISLGEKPAGGIWKTVLRAAGRITGLPRHLGVHPGGLVITPEPIERYVPLENAPGGMRIVTWDKDDCEECGLVKMDLLGNRSLGVVRDAIENMKKNGIAFEETSWEPVDSYSARKLLGSGNTMGIFYVESPAMRQLQEKTGKGVFEHLVIHSSIIRPAANKLIKEYIRRLRGEKWDRLPQKIEKILEGTYGIMCYQEDLSKTAVAMAGFSPAEGERLRKIVCKKERGSRLEEYRERFFAGAAKEGYGRGDIEKVWEMILSFDGYSFCKSHSASYAMVSFQSAWLKANRPAEFMAAVISNGGGYYSVQAYVSEARRMGITILPPDVNRSAIRFSGKGMEILTGLLAVRGLRETTMSAIVDERNRGGEFKNIDDFRRRVKIDAREADSLVYSGALDSISGKMTKPQQMWSLFSTPRKSQLTLFETEKKPPELTPIPKMKQLRKEFEILGFLTTFHPLRLYAKQLSKEKRNCASEIPQLVGKTVLLAGWLVSMKRVMTTDGKSMAFLSFDDETDIYECVIFPDRYQKLRRLIDGRPLLIFGKVQEEDGALQIEIINLRPTTD